MKRFAIIMAGGAGERFWPLSRKAKPKHLWNVTGAKSCLLSMTYSRLRGVVSPENIFVVTNAEQVEAIVDTCPEISRERIIVEPTGRDTTAAIGFSAVNISRMSGGEDSSFAVFPSDHVVSDESAFADTLRLAFEVAEGGDRLVTIGIKPTFPATGYGYIRRGEKFTGDLGDYYKVARFFEKPNLPRATEYVESGDYYWNAGIFVWKTSAILSAIANNAPATFSILQKIAAASPDKFLETVNSLYGQIEKISIDFSVMEHAQNAWTVLSRFHWDDVGSWAAVERHCAKNCDGNVAVGELFARDSRDCVVFDTSGRATALLGVEGLVVVHAPDATLICKKEDAEKLKELVKTLPDKYR